MLKISFFIYYINTLSLLNPLRGSHKILLHRTPESFPCSGRSYRREKYRVSPSDAVSHKRSPIMRIPRRRDRHFLRQSVLPDGRTYSTENGRSALFSWKSPHSDNIRKDSRADFHFPPGTPLPSNPLPRSENPENCLPACAAPRYNAPPETV